MNRVRVDTVLLILKSLCRIDCHVLYDMSASQYVARVHDEPRSRHHIAPLASSGNMHQSRHTQLVEILWPKSGNESEQCSWDLPHQTYIQVVIVQPRHERVVTPYTNQNSSRRHPLQHFCYTKYVWRFGEDSLDFQILEKVIGRKRFRLSPGPQSFSDHRMVFIAVVDIKEIASQLYQILSRFQPPRRIHRALIEQQITYH